MKIKAVENIFSLKLGLVGFLMGLASCSSSSYERTDHYDGKKFFNSGVQVNKGFLQVIKWQLTSDKEEWPEWVDDNVKSDLATQVANQEVSLTFVNHATHLIQLPGLNVLTDPIFSKRASPLHWAGPSRHRPPGLSLEELPAIQIVFISHNHYDHMDLPSIRSLVEKHDPVFVTPLGNKKIIERAGARKIIELDWWQKMELPNGGTLNMVQVQHWSARSPFDTNEALWGGFVLQANGLNIYFGGDSGYGPHYLETKKRYGAMDVSLLPIGSYEPRWFMKEQHMNPEEAVQAHQDLESKMSIGIHIGTFDLADEGVNRPMEALKTSLDKKGLSQGDFVVPKNGQTHFYRKSKN